MSSSKKLLQAGLVKFGAITAGRLLARETVRSTIRGQVRRLLTGSKEKPYQLVPAAERAADHLIAILENRISTPACIGIDGIAGSGKSTLGRSLSAKLDLEWRTLFGREMDRPVSLEPGTIYENIRLFRTQDIDRFDAIIYIDVPIETAKKRVLSRDRNGALVDFLDYEKLKKIGDVAFEAADGEAVPIPESPATVKIRPKSGYRLAGNLAQRLEAKGLDKDGLCVEEMLFLLCYGEAQRGIKPYVRFGAYNQDILTGALSGLLVALDMLS